MRTRPIQTFAIPVTFRAYGIAEVEANSLDNAVKRAVAQTILPDMVDLDGLYTVDTSIRDADASLDPMFETKNMTHQLLELPRRLNGERLLNHYGVAVSFHLAGVVHIDAESLDDAITIAEADTPLPLTVQQVYDYTIDIEADTRYHGAQRIPFLDCVLTEMK